MKTYKKLGVEVSRRRYDGGWGVTSDRGGNGEKAQSNKGVAVLEFLKAHYKWNGKEWS
jgi:hypothetical protein